MSYGLICEDCGCPFFYQEEDGYYCEDCERVIRNFTCFLIPFFQADYLRGWTYLI